MVVFMLKGAAATLVAEGMEGGRSIETAHPPYLGSSHTSVSGVGVYLHSHQLCEPSKSMVSGKVVYTDFSSDFKFQCDWDTMYDHLDNAGALGIAFMARGKKPGVNLFKHSFWDACFLCNRKMAAVMMYVGAIDLDAWQRKSDLVLHITPTHDTT